MEVKELDLHGVRHVNVHKELDTFFGSVDFPAIVITGQSNRMKELVTQIASRYDLIARPSYTNPGRLIIYAGAGDVL